MIGHNLATRLRPGERTKRAAPPIMEIVIVILLALNLKAIYDVHQLTESHRQIVNQIAVIVHRGDEDQVASCYARVPVGEEAQRLARFARSFTSNLKAIDALRDYLFTVAGSFPVKQECDALAVKLGVIK